MFTVMTLDWLHIGFLVLNKENQYKSSKYSLDLFWVQFTTVGIVWACLVHILLKCCNKDCIVKVGIGLYLSLSPG